LGEQTIGRLRNEPRLKGKIVDVRGRGLMLGIELAEAPEKFIDKALARGLVINLTARKVVRLAPAINIPAEEWGAGLDRVIELIASL